MTRFLRSAALALLIIPQHALARDISVQSATVTTNSPGEQAAIELAKLGTPQTAALARALRRSDWSARRIEGVGPLLAWGAVEPLMVALTDSDPRIRRIAAWGLSEIRPAPSSALVPLSRLLTDPEPLVRAEAVGALGDFDAFEFSPRIVLMLKDPAAIVRARAAHALGDIQATESAAALEAALADPEAEVRDEAEWALLRVREAVPLGQRAAR